VISHLHESIFIHVPKCAGTSMGKFLRTKNFSNISYHQAKDGSHDNETGAYKIGTSRRLKRGLEDIWQDYFKFGFVRNPWDRSVSCWKNRGGPYKEFKDFIKAYPYEKNGDAKRSTQNIIWHALPQYVHLCDENGDLIVDFIGRFENIESDLYEVCRVLDINYEELGRHNATERKPYQEYYDQETIDRVAEIYKKDIEMFNYDY
jgi:hypothetical protein